MPDPADSQATCNNNNNNNNNFTIAIIGSGPIGKLLPAFAKPHPRISFVQYEAEKLPLRPSFGYGVGPQTLHAAEMIHPDLGRLLREKCFLGTVWMNFYHGGVDDCLIASVQVPEDSAGGAPGVYGRLGRGELMDLLDGFAPEGHVVQYGRRIGSIRDVVAPVGDEKDGRASRGFELRFQDGSFTRAHAVWGIDGINSMCRRFIVQEEQQQQQQQKTGHSSSTDAHYCGMLAFRGRVPAEQVAKQVGRGFDEETFMCLGVKGWCILVFPIDSGEFINIAAFCEEPVYMRKGRDHVVTLDEILSYFPGRNERIDRLLRLLSQTPGGPQRLELTAIGHLPPFYLPGGGGDNHLHPPLTTFGDAANGMLPFIAGSMSTGFIGAATFLREYNARVASLPSNATDATIAAALAEASAVYDMEHRPLAQQLHDYSAEQGPLWCSGIVDDVEELSRRPRFLWKAADHLEPLQPVK